MTHFLYGYFHFIFLFREIFSDSLLFLKKIDTSMARPFLKITSIKGSFDILRFLFLLQFTYKLELKMPKIRWYIRDSIIDDGKKRIFFILRPGHIPHFIGLRIGCFTQSPRGKKCHLNSRVTFMQSEIFCSVHSAVRDFV